MADDKITTLKQERARAITEMRRIHETAEAENRDLNAEESQEFERLTTASSEFQARVDRAEKLRSEATAENRFHDRMDGSALGHDRDERALTAEVRAYNTAFGAYLRGNETAEQKSILAAGEQRDGMVVGTGSLGGYTVPQDFSSKLFSLKVQAGGVRQTKVTVFTTGDGRLMPVPYASAHAAANWGTEATAPSVTSETFALAGAATNLGAFPAVVLEKLSIELIQDSAFDLESYLSTVIGQKIGRLQNAAYIAGSGSGQPTGMINVGSVAELETAAAAGPTDTEAQAWYYKLGPQYRVNAEILAHDSLVQVLTGLKSSAGGYLYLPSLRDGIPNQFMGVPVINDPDLQATGTDEHVCGMIADFANFYVIRDVNELVVQRLNERFADSRQVGFIAWQRTDGVVVDLAAGAQLAVGAG